MESKKFILNENQICDLRNLILDAQYKISKIKNENPFAVADIKNDLNRALQMVGVNRCIDCDHCDIKNLKCHFVRENKLYCVTFDLKDVDITQYGECGNFKIKNQNST